MVDAPTLLQGLSTLIRGAFDEEPLEVSFEPQASLTFPYIILSLQNYDTHLQRAIFKISIGLFGHANQRLTITQHGQTIGQHLIRSTRLTLPSGELSVSLARGEEKYNHLSQNVHAITQTYDGFLNT
jgi:hypothetical protein